MNARGSCVVVVLLAATLSCLGVLFSLEVGFMFRLAKFGVEKTLLDCDQKLASAFFSFLLKLFLIKLFLNRFNSAVE
jgi:hypothetical protein